MHQFNVLVMGIKNGANAFFSVQSIFPEQKAQILQMRYRIFRRVQESFSMFSSIKNSIKYRVMFKVNYRSKIQTENYGLGHFRKI